ncbi:MAG: sulfatase [Acidobacteria bacterium]|nr:sulfatase [Acidobacteriota bacterium]
MKASRFASFTLLLALAGCGGGSSDQPIVWRLVDNFDKEMVKNVPSQVTRPEPAGLWEFGKPLVDPPKEAAATQGWKVATAVSALSIVDGRLQGRTTTDFPIIYVERDKGLDTPDLLYAVEIRMRADKGANVSIQPQGSGELKVDEILDRAKGLSQPWNLNAPLIAGDDIQTYTMRPPAGTRLSSMNKLLIRPSDEAGAQFEIESLKIVSRREHLSLIPSGVGWQGLAEIYRETIVSRAPESIQLDLTLPAHPWLDLQIGTVEDAPVTFEVRVASAGSNAAEGDAVLQRTITTPDRWEKATVDLSAYAGRNVVVSLALKSENDDALGFWGGTAIRDRGRPSRDTNQRPEVEAIAGSPAPQGVILIVADTLRKDHLNFHGYERATAPFLANLGTQGAVFRDNVVQATWTKVSVPTIQSGMYPLAHGVSDVRDRLPAAAVMIAEIYRDAGYATVGYSSVPFSDQLTNLHQGYEELHERGSIEESGTKTSRIYIDRLSEWLDTHRDVPFFVFLHVFDPHSPFEPRRPYNTMWADPAKRDEHEENAEKVKEFIKDASDKNRVMPMLEELKASGVDQEAFMGYNKGWYDGSIRGLDAEVTRLIEKLRSLGLADKTLLAFTSDHGEGFHEHGYMWHGQHIYGELTGVPLMFYGPSFVPAGPGFDVTTRSIDIAPTLLELSHLPKPGTMQGQSLVPLMAGSESWQPQPAISQKAATNQTGGPRPYDTEAYAIVSDGWKLIHHTKPDVGKPEFELFNHADDPLDLKDVSGDNSDRVKTLAALLESERTRILEGALPEGDSTENLSGEELQRLRSLGYIQ